MHSAHRGRAVAGAAVLCATLAACSSAPEGGPSSSSPEPAADIALSGWKLTLPVANAKGGAAQIDPADVSPPWLVRDGVGALVFWAPVLGATTPNSEHARTELNSLRPFEAAGSGPHTLHATVTVTQVPTDGKDVIVGQLHGTSDISSVPFVMLHYQDGTVFVVVKRQQKGSSSTKVPLLADVPLGTRFAYTVSDDGDGNLTFTASSGTQQARATVAMPAAFNGASVRFQAGAYQLADSAAAAAAGTGADDGAKVTFSELTEGTDAVVEGSPMPPTP